MPLATDPLDLALDANGDLEIPLRHVSGLEGVAQLIRIRLSMIRGEWFHDLDAGVPYLPSPGIDPAAVILGSKRFDPVLAEAQFRDAISRVPGVAAIESMSVVLGANRRLTVTWKVVTEFDDTTIEGTTPVGV